MKVSNQSEENGELPADVCVLGAANRRFTQSVLPQNAGRLNHLYTDSIPHKSGELIHLGRYLEQKTANTVTIEEETIAIHHNKTSDSITFENIEGVEKTVVCSKQVSAAVINALHRAYADDTLTGIETVRLNILLQSLCDGVTESNDGKLNDSCSKEVIMCADRVTSSSQPNPTLSAPDLGDLCTFDSGIPKKETPRSLARCA